MVNKIVSCSWCGELVDIPGYLKGDGPVSCGERECEKEVYRMHIDERDEMIARAEEDDYERYRL